MFIELKLTSESRAKDSALCRILKRPGSMCCQPFFGGDLGVVFTPQDVIIYPLCSCRSFIDNIFYCIQI